MNESLRYQIENFVTKMLSGAHERIWPFHNIHHVRVVVQKCQELAQAYQLDPQTTDELTIAAWFHDVGYVHGSEVHEWRSGKICEVFLKIYGWDKPSLQRIMALIQATKYPGRPKTQAEEILCDADLYHLASDDYTHWARRLYKELNEQQGETLSKRDWINTNIEFLQRHRYFTGYAASHWEPAKRKNLEELRRKGKVPHGGTAE